MHSTTDSRESTAVNSFRLRHLDNTPRTTFAVAEHLPVCQPAMPATVKLIKSVQVRRKGVRLDRVDSGHSRLAEVISAAHCAILVLLVGYRAEHMIHWLTVGKDGISLEAPTRNMGTVHQNALQLVPPLPTHI